jgi:hypothetical protein
VLPLPGTTGTITGPVSVCPNTSNNIYSIAAVTNATGYIWTVPSGWSIISGQNTLSINVTAGTVGGNISVTANNTCGTGTTSTLPITVNTPPTADAGADQTIGYGATTILNGSATGGNGNYTYQWAPASLLVNPNVQNPVTLNLTSSVQFTLTVTDGGGCAGTDQVLVTVSGGPLSVNPTATPNTSCAGSFVQLMSNAGGGTGNYTYAWTSNPSGFTSTFANPTDYPTVSTTYTVVVNDGNATVSGSVLVTVNPLPETPTIPVGPDTVDLYTITNSTYITSVPSADSLVWELAPTSAGVIMWSGLTTATVTWNPNYLGNATIRVHSLNNCGESQWSDIKNTFVDNTTGFPIYEEPLKITIFPNPTTGDFFVSIQGACRDKHANVTIFGMLGERMMEAEVDFGVTRLFSLRNKPAGLYYFHLETGGQVIIQKLLKL